MSLPHLARRKNARINFSVMVVGRSGLGKSTFINSLCGTDLIPVRPSPSAEDIALEKTLTITPYQLELDEDGLRLSLTIIDTPGFGDNINNEAAFQPILCYIEDQFDNVLLEETRIKRNPKFQDNRVHCLLYFIQPTGHALTELDIKFMQTVGSRVNILPVIAKADSLSRSELVAFRKRIMEDFVHYKIPYYNFPYDPEEDDEETVAENEEIRQLLPFAIIGAEGTYSVNGRQVRGRKYPWGVCEIENPSHCDFSRLRYVLMSSHLQDLRDITHEYLYENYRTHKLLIEEKNIAPDTLENPSIRDEVVKQVLINEELLKQEQEKLRAKEIQVTQEFDSKRRELAKKEFALKEMELRMQSQSSDSLAERP